MFRKRYLFSIFLTKSKGNCNLNLDKIGVLFNQKDILSLNFRNITNKVMAKNIDSLKQRKLWFLKTLGITEFCNYLL